ncbi:hypothetical protein PG996_013986 [Apiospora saccharicola]|uniref:RNase III domain-containing protein n=1 Tax=Apiospora saccharicola TaxID=335842 RepID=A0ABR1THN0_9PEZI
MEKSAATTLKLFTRETRGFAVALERLKESLETPQPSHPYVASRAAAARFLHFGPSKRNKASFSTPLSSKIAKCEGILGYTFQSKLLLAEALTPDGGEAYSVVNNGQQCHTHSSSRLAIYGDALMLAYVARQWLQHSPTRLTDSNRSWTTLRHMYLNNRHLLAAAQRLGLTECTHVRTPEEGGLVSPYWGWVSAQTVEAIAAAAYLDGGDRALARVMELVGCHKVFSERKKRQGGKEDAEVLHDEGNSARREDHAEQDSPERGQMVNRMM